MLRRLIFVGVFLIIFGTFVVTAFSYENEKSNIYYMQKDDQYALAAIDTDELYTYGFYLEDDLTLTNGENYTTFGELKDDKAETMEYLQYTFSLKEIRYLDVNNPDYGTKFANYLVSTTQGTYEEFSASLTDLPKSYESGFNVQYLRLADLANYNSEGYMDKEILTNIVQGNEDEDVNTIGVPVDETMTKKVFINIQDIPLTCSEDICTLDETMMTSTTKTLTKLINEEVIYINQYSGLEAK